MFAASVQLQEQWGKYMTWNDASWRMDFLLPHGMQHTMQRLYLYWSAPNTIDSVVSGAGNVQKIPFSHINFAK